MGILGKLSAAIILKPEPSPFADAKPDVRAGNDVDADNSMAARKLAPPRSTGGKPNV